MKFGYFNDTDKEYVINTPKTPYPWINYLGNEDFFSLMSNTCGGYSFYKDARLRRISRYRYNNSTLDSNGKYIYIKDGENIWNPGWKPVKNALDAYECRHGMGYTKIKGQKNELEANLLSFVPIGFTGEIQQLTLKNLSASTKTIKLFSFIEFCLWDALDDATNFQRNFSIGRAENVGNAIIHFTDYRDRRHHFAFHSVNQDIMGYDCDRESFTGTHNGLDCPDVVMNGKTTNSVAHGWAPIGALQVEVNLDPGEEKDIIFMLGFVENSIEDKWTTSGDINTSKMEKMISEFSDRSKVDQAMDELKSFWDNLLANYTTKTPDERVDRMVNIWNQYQCMVTFNLSRSASFFESGIGRGMGFRDSNQDLLGFVHQVPDRARERLIDLAATQLEDGGAYHQYQPLTKKGNNEVGGGFNDDPLWLIAAAIAYIKETGDFTILDESVPYDNDDNLADTFFNHLERAFNYTVNNLGPHKLPLIGRADWNDCMNLNIYNEDPSVSFQTGPQKTDGKVAESLMIAGAFVLYGRQFAELCDQTGNKDLSNKANGHIQDMIDAINQHGWDGNWFLRAYDAKGRKVGSHENEEGKIFIESNGFCGMAGIGLDDGRLKKAMDSVKKYLDSDYGLVLHNPAFTRYYIEYGEISTFLPGYKENAGIFCHNNPWIIISETLLGRGDQAYEYWAKIAPAFNEEISELHKTEPYVYAQMIGGKDAYKPGEAKNSWLTGTAAWNFITISQNILGIQPQYNGLRIDPCIPKDWDGFEVQRKFRGEIFNITVKNPYQVNKGIKKVILDGKEIDTNILPLGSGSNEHTVEVIMG